MTTVTAMVTQKLRQMTSEASIPEPPNVFIYNEDKKYHIPNNVTHVKVDPSVKEIHNYAFDNCHSLVEVEFSEGLEVIGMQAFWHCSNLKYVNKLPSTLKPPMRVPFPTCYQVLRFLLVLSAPRIHQ
jgi:hypothetical protein